MSSQRRLVDRVRGFSPTRETWVDKPAKDLPHKVTVRFRTGQTGFLDMKNVRAIHWANMIDRLERAHRPVYVEVDEESQVITRVLIPRVNKVKALTPDDRGNIRVRLDPSQAVHLLLHSDPNFEAMRDQLQIALDNDSELLVTDTRDEHEIIDVRSPAEAEGNPTGPTPTPPDDPPVSEARAQELFNDMNAKSCVPCNPSSDCIPFLYPDDGCWARAHKMCYLMRHQGETPEKVWNYGNLVVATANHPDCYVGWWYHVAPTLALDTPGNPKFVVDPSVSPGAESEAAWQGRQTDTTSTLTDSDWTQYWPDGGTATQEENDAVLDDYRDDLHDRCQEFGPPPYSCTRGCFFIIDRSTFSDYEIEAMLHVSAPAVVQGAFYFVLDGYSPDELGFTAATMQRTPALNTSPAIVGMTITPVRLEFEYPSHLNRRQRLTWVYDVSFANTGGFTSPLTVVTLEAWLYVESGTGYFYLIQQPNPYEVDGETSWLSTDLRVFQIRQGESKFGVAMASDPSAFITQVLANLNGGTTGGQTFENDISLDPETSRLELSGTVGGTQVYNFAVAKVRYRSLLTSATDVRVFFRLFPAETTSLEYDQGTTYRRHTSGGTVVPLLGIKAVDFTFHNVVIKVNEIASIPCFAAPRVDSAVASMTTQMDPANVLTMPPNASGAEVVRYFGCWLDINRTQPQFPVVPTPVDGPYTRGRRSIQDLIRNEHQCLVSEIAFTPAPAQNGSTPSVSDKLAQRNLAIVQSANPGLVFSRRISQTFEFRPSAAKQDHDELMIDWGNVPEGSIATLYLPGIAVNDILLLAARKYRTHRLLRIDEHTLRFDTGGINYVPIPFTDGNLPGLLTVDLPGGIEKGQVFKVVVRQVTGEQQVVTPEIAEKSKRGVRHVVGSFQLTIPTRTKADILPGQQRLLSNLRWIERAIPTGNRWAPVFGKYVAQVAARVDALGGNSSQVAASSSGQWQEAYRTCLLFMVVASLFVAVLEVGSGTAVGGVALLGGIPVVTLLASTVYLWRKKCRPTTCQLLRALLAGSAVGALFLALMLLFGQPTPRLVAALLVSAGVTATAAIVGWLKGCFG